MTERHVPFGPDDESPASHERPAGRDAPDLNPALPAFLCQYFRDRQSEVLREATPAKREAAHLAQPRPLTKDEINAFFYSTWPDLHKRSEE